MNALPTLLFLLGLLRLLSAQDRLQRVLELVFQMPASADEHPRNLAFAVDDHRLRNGNSLVSDPPREPSRSSATVTLSF